MTFATSELFIHQPFNTQCLYGRDVRRTLVAVGFKKAIIISFATPWEFKNSPWVRSLAPPPPLSCVSWCSWCPGYRALVQQALRPVGATGCSSSEQVHEFPTLRSVGRAAVWARQSYIRDSTLMSAGKMNIHYWRSQDWGHEGQNDYGYWKLHIFKIEWINGIGPA